MEIIPPGIHFNFVGRMKPFALVSAGLVLLTILVIVGRGGFNYGIDFAGGTLLQLRFQGVITVDQVRATLRKLNLAESEIQRYGSDLDFILRVPSTAEDLERLRSQIIETFQEEYGEGRVDLVRAEQVGPKVGKDLRRKALLAVLGSAVGISLYIWWRFGFRLEFALGVVIADIHDVMLTLGVFAITGKEVTLTVLAAILTIAGYSINDSIVVLDRIRENNRMRLRDPFAQIVNASINETLSRTFLTGGSVIFAILALLFFGGEILHDFALVLLIGVLVGTYSSIFVVAPVLLYWPRRATSRPTQRAPLHPTPPVRKR